MSYEERVYVNDLLDNAWRRDPSTMGAHLNPVRFKRWRYVALMGDAFRRAATGESKRLIVMLPARYGKTLVSSVWGPVWALDRDPAAHIILTSYGHELAVKNSSQVRDLVDQYGSQLRVKARSDRRARDRWETTAGGQVMSAGVGGAMTGFGGHIVVCDDPFKNWQEASSQFRRDLVWDWFRSVVYTRLQTSDSSIVIVGTRWHEDDLVGRCLNPPDGELPENWEVLRLPALAEAPNLNSPHAWEQQPDPLGREPGEPLEPERFTLEAVKDRARVLGSFLAAALEQQRPMSAEGGLLKRDWWKWYVPRPTTPDDWVITWDASFKGADTSDYCVGAVWCREGSDKYLLDLVRDRMDYPRFKQAVVDLATKWPEARTILIEDKANGPAVMAELRGTISGIVPFTPVGSKESRVHAISGDVEAGNVWLPDPSVNDIDDRVDRSFVHDYVHELSSFPNGMHDDMVDVTTMALMRWTNAATAGFVGTYVRTAGRR